MSNNKQTAVEWLVKQIENHIHHTIRIPSEYVEQAKEMEKQQIVKAWDDADYAYFSSKETGIDFENGKEYYNEEYGANNEQQ
jgi:hypothetical protein